MDRFVEVCCQSYEDALICKRAGVDQIELNSGLYLGGLTPSLGLVRKIKNDIDIPIMAMVRPRAGGFSYSEYEYGTILDDIDIFLKEDVDGIVFGCLKSDGSLDMKKNKEIVKRIKSEGKIAVFHRAFDQVENPFKSIEYLIDIGVDRLLTSGQKPFAVDGIDLLKILEANYSGDIEILIGSGINGDNVKLIYEKTGIKRFHGSCKTWREDRTARGNVSYAYADNPNEINYEVTDIKLASRLVKAVKDL